MIGLPMTAPASFQPYELFAIRYAARPGLRSQAFTDVDPRRPADPHDTPLPMNYYIWLARNGTHTFVIDMGFCHETAAQRHRKLDRTPAEGLALMGLNAQDVKDIIVTHMHYDHVGTYGDFPNARFHLQDKEMAYATGRHMQHWYFNLGYEVEDVTGMVRLVYQNRVRFHDGDAELAPGISIHRIGGHTHGMQCVRVQTQRGPVVLASDAAHYYEHFQDRRIFIGTFNAGETIQGYRRLQELADGSLDHIVPGHDPLVMEKYPPAPGLEGIAVRLHVAPKA
jgi:glyoxylase-like metal-dependent hydrolase (beta-lactamase superfamily II)